MNVKIDTKERFTVITPEEAHLSVNMTDELNELLLGYLQKDIPHVILKMDAVRSVDEQMGENIATLQSKFYENNCSFVICNLQKDVVDTEKIQAKYEDGVLSITLPKKVASDKNKHKSKVVIK